MVRPSVTAQPCVNTEANQPHGPTPDSNTESDPESGQPAAAQWAADNCNNSRLSSKPNRPLTPSGVPSGITNPTPNLVYLGRLNGEETFVLVRQWIGLDSNFAGPVPSCFRVDRDGKIFEWAETYAESGQSVEKRMFPFIRVGSSTTGWIKAESLSALPNQVPPAEDHAADDRRSQGMSRPRDGTRKRKCNSEEDDELEKQRRKSNARYTQSQTERDDQGNSTDSSPTPGLTPRNQSPSKGQWPAVAQQTAELEVVLPSPALDVTSPSDSLGVTWCTGTSVATFGPACRYSSPGFEWMNIPVIAVCPVLLRLTVQLN